MKLVLSVFLTLPLLVHAKPNLFERIRGKGNGLVVGNRNGKGPDSDKLPDQVDISDRIKAKFLQKSKVKKNWSPKYQRISKDAPYFIIGGEQVLMEDLYPVDDIFHPDATVTVGGVEQPPKVNIYTTAAFPNLRVLLEENGKKVKRVVRLEPNGNVIELVEVEDDIFAEIDSYADLEVPEGDFDMGSYFPEGLVRKLSKSNLRQRRANSLTSGCTNDIEAVLDLFIVADSDFSAETRAAGMEPVDGAMMVFNMVQDLYWKDCIRIRLKGLDVKEGGDEYKRIREQQGNRVCPADDTRLGLLGGVKVAYESSGGLSWPDPDADLVHVFYGGPGEPGTNTIGCAYVGVLCYQTWGVGVSHVSYNDYRNTIHMRNLVAHEVGHNLGASHVSDTSSIMFWSITDSGSFNDPSLAAIHKCVNGVGCRNSCLNFQARQPLVTAPTPSTTTTTPPPPTTTTTTTTTSTTTTTTTTTTPPPPTTSTTTTTATTPRPKLPEIVLVLLDSSKPEGSDEVKQFYNSESYTIDLGNFPSGFSIEAKQVGSTFVDSARFYRDNQFLHQENAKPYCINGDAGSAHAWTGYNANDVTRVTAYGYTGGSGGGIASAPFEILIRVSSAPPPTPRPTPAPTPQPTPQPNNLPSIDLYVMDVSSGSETQKLMNVGSYTIRLSDFSGGFSIDARAIGGTEVGCVRYYMGSGTSWMIQQENMGPFAVAGDSWGADGRRVFDPWTTDYTIGQSFTLTAIPNSVRKFQGVTGNPVTVTLLVTN